MLDYCVITPASMLEFRELLRALVRERLGSQELLAQKLAVTQKTISLTMLGKIPPPIDDRLDAWADALGLNGEDRDTFRRAAFLAHTPEVIREEIQQDRIRIAELEDRVTRLAMTISDLLDGKHPPRP